MSQQRPRSPMLTLLPRSFQLVQMDIEKRMPPASSLSGQILSSCSHRSVVQSMTQGDPSLNPALGKRLSRGHQITLAGNCNNMNTHHGADCCSKQNPCSLHLPARLVCLNRKQEHNTANKCHCANWCQLNCEACIIVAPQNQPFNQAGCPFKVATVTFSSKYSRKWAF